MHVNLQHLTIQIKMMEDGTEFLNERKELLDEQKKSMDEHNEDLEKQCKAKEEANKKRLIAKLQRDKNPEIKTLIMKEEEQIQNNEDFQNKLRGEIEKSNTLLDEHIQLTENSKLMKNQFTETTKNIEVQTEEMTKLTEAIKTKQTDVNARLKLVEEMRKKNAYEQEKNKKYAKANAALQAKLEFIESKYDYSSSAK